MTNEKFFEMFIETAKNAYIEIMGKEKWNSLTNEEKHDAVMMLAKGMYIALATKQADGRRLNRPTN